MTMRISREEERNFLSGLPQGFGFAGRNPHVLHDRLPLPIGILHLNIGNDQTIFVFLGGGHEGTAIGPVDPTIQTSNA